MLCRCDDQTERIGHDVVNSTKLVLAMKLREAKKHETDLDS